MQWHPLLAELLRPVLQSFYEVQTNVPVGDVPREADIVLLRRKSAGPAPFRGIWADLNTWNILEFKSPAVTPRLQDVDLLIELGLGIERRLNEERAKDGLARVPPFQVSWWYLANRLSGRFLERCRHRLGGVGSAGQGVWRSRLMERSLVLVSNSDLPVDRESVPLHIVSRGSHSTELALARFVAERPELQASYGAWVTTLHARAWKEVGAMARATKELEFNLEALAEYVGLDRLIEEFGLKQVIAKVGLRRVVDEVGLKQVIDEVGLRRVVDEVGLKRVMDEVGLKQVIDEVGLKRLMDEVGLKRVVDEVGLDAWLASLTPAQRRELKRRLK